MASTSRTTTWLLDENEAQHALELWGTRKFDTHDIARFLRVPEHAVCRLIQATRDIMREQKEAGK
ncbi:hypothetical protein C5748_16310 [Phyllobacterium phragmitis]|uniref:Uncharacterized protein n=1 Tax=Phyllobacterium phragmitis TaxID=2670329 RepID=A0A2S9IPA0_9HYPH|nr:hypothetical protein [Phyllobacterium phragmitis]PRD42356.1 hypothetical protein C5748_16310 [Phyllobacterium phragmitis]